MEVISNLFKNEILFHPHLFHVVIRLSLFLENQAKIFLVLSECLFPKAFGVFCAH